MLLPAPGWSASSRVALCGSISNSEDRQDGGCSLVAEDRRVSQHPHSRPPLLTCVLMVALLISATKGLPQPQELRSSHQRDQTVMGRPGAAPFAVFRSMSRSNLQKAEAIAACGWAFSSLPPARCTLICGPRVHPRYYHFMLSVRLGVDGPTRTDLPSSLARDAKGCTWQSISRRPMPRQ